VTTETQTKTLSIAIGSYGHTKAIKDGKRVPKAQRVTNADGSWREEIRQGPCVTIREGSPQGEIKITRKCD
jgi:hypothetical protein